MTEAPLRISRTLALPLESVTQTFGILAKRGVGKTYTAAVMVEEFLKQGLQTVVVDPIGVWWGLRAGADGKKAGLPIVVLGGDHGDVPLAVTAGPTIADLIVSEGLSVVLDLSEFRKGEQTRFMQDFAERLYYKNRKPLHLVLDEADAFAPQRPMPGQQRLLGAIEDLVRRGRARGIGVTLVTQRAAVLNKNVLTQVEVLVTLRTISPQDRKAIDEWVRVHGTTEERDELMVSLPSLPIGTAWFWSPGWLNLFKKVKIRRRETFDSSATPKVGQRLTAPKKLAPVDLEALKQRISATIERAKSEDPRELRRQIARLTKERDTAKREAGKIEVVHKDVPVIRDSQITRFEKAVGSLQGILGDFTVALAKVSHNGTAPASRPVPRAPIPRQVTTSPAPAREPKGEVNLRRGERRMLEALATRHPVAVTKAQLGTLSGFAPRGGTFGTYFGVLKRRALLEETDQGFVISTAGLAELGMTEPPAPQTTEEILAMWRGALRKGERSMLDTLVDVYPELLTREDLGERTGFTVSGGTFGTYLGVLRRNGLVEVEGGTVRASETLFLTGVPR